MPGKNREYTLPKPKNKKANTYTRRNILIGAATVATAGLGGYEILHKSDTSPFIGWEKYIDKNLPPYLVKEIGEKISNMKQYPGFPAIGNLLADSQTNSPSVSKYTTLLTSPLTLGLSDLFTNGSALSVFGEKMDMLVKPITLTNKTTKAKTQILLGDPSTLYPYALLDNSFATAGIPEWASSLFIVKELSQLYLQSLVEQAIFKEVSDKYDIQSPSIKDLPLALLETAFVISGSKKDNITNPANINTDLFSHLHTDWDLLGYWYILPALAKMRDDGYINSSGREKVLHYDLAMLDIALQKGFLIKNQDGSYIHTPNLYPFSNLTFTKQWRETAGPIVDEI